MPSSPERSRRSATRRDEDGGALLAVLAFGVLASLVMLALVGRTVQESRAVADSLAQTRAYWAAMGVNDYALSRTMQAGYCSGSNCGAGTLTTVQQNYINEITDMQLWQYPEVSGSYRISLKPVAGNDGVNNAQEMVIRTTFASPAAAIPNAPGSSGTVLAAAVPDALAQLGRLRPVEFRYCLVASATSPCSSGASKALPGYQLITSVHCPAS